MPFNNLSTYIEFEENQGNISHLDLQRNQAREHQTATSFFKTVLFHVIVGCLRQHLNQPTVRQGTVSSNALAPKHLNHKEQVVNAHNTAVVAWDTVWFSSQNNLCLRIPPMQMAQRLLKQHNNLMQCIQMSIWATTITRCMFRRASTPIHAWIQYAMKTLYRFSPISRLMLNLKETSSSWKENNQRRLAVLTRGKFTT